MLERACLALYHGFFSDLGDTHLLACQWSGRREISVELTMLFPYFTFFTTCVHNITIYLLLLTTFYLRVGDIESAWLTRSVVSKTLIHFDFYTFLADTRTTINIGAILLASVLYCYMRIFVLRSLYGVLYISIHLHTIFLIYTGQWQGPAGLFGYCVWIPWRPL